MEKSVNGIYLQLAFLLPVAPDTIEDVEPKTVQVELQAEEVPARELAPLEKAPEEESTAAALGWHHPPANVEDASMQWFLLLVLVLILLLRLLAWLLSVGCCICSYLAFDFEAL